MAKPRARKRPAPRAPDRSPSPRRFAWAPLVVVLAGLVAYANSLTGSFLFDDQRAIVENPSIRALATALTPPTQTPLTGRPLANLSFALNFAVHGLSVRGYHIVNIGLHILAALALLGVLRRTFARTPFVKDGHEASEALALCCALVWVVHPLNTEALNYLTQRTEVMMGLFVLLALYASIRGLDAGHAGRWQLLAGLGALCGVAAKETAVVLPLAVVLWDRTFAFPSLGAAWTKRRGLYAILAVCWLLFVFLARDTPFFSSTGFREQTSRLTYLLNQGPTIARYLRLAFWPAGLVFDYGVTLPITVGQAWPGVALIAALFALSVAALSRWTAFGFWGAWFFITLAPASSVIPIPTEVGAERRMYLPLIGVIVVAGMLMLLLLRKLAGEGLRAKIGWTLGAATVLGLTTATIARNGDYRDGLSIWQTVLERRPHARAHEHLSMFLRDAGRIDESIAHLRTAAPESTNARHALASALLEQGDVKGAIAEFKEFIRLDPRDPNIVSARKELATALLRDKDVDGAIEQYRELLRLQARDLALHRGLLVLLLDQKRFGEAEIEGRTLVALSPDDAVTHTLLGAALASQGRLAEAREQFAEAVRLDPSSEDARNSLARANEALQTPPGERR